MKHSFRLAGLALATAAVTVAAVSKPSKHLTPQRVAEVNALRDAAVPGHVTLALSGFAKVTTPPDGRKAVTEMIREFRFPTEFEAPNADAAVHGKANGPAPDGGVFPVTPTTPRAFDTIHTGWTITMTTAAHGGLIDVYGVAEYVQVELVPGGYGALSGPIMSDGGVLITPNKLEQPKTNTTTTRFHVFAIPGESYDVTLYRDNKAEKHALTVTAE